MPAEREIARAAERRLESEVVSKRAEVESLSKLVDTVNKLEASVGAKAQAGTWRTARRFLSRRKIRDTPSITSAKFNILSLARCRSTLPGVCRDAAVGGGAQEPQRAARTGTQGRRRGTPSVTIT